MKINLSSKSFSYFIVLLLVWANSPAYSQQTVSIRDKPVIDSNAFSKWPEIQEAMISNDGKYSMFVVADNRSLRMRNHLLHIHNNLTGLDLVVNNAEALGFSNNSKQAYFMKSRDSLGTLDLKTSAVQYLTGINSFQIAKEGDWVAYLSSTSAQELIVKNTATNKSRNYQSVIRYNFSKDGKVLLVQSVNKKNNDAPRSLFWVDLSDGKATEIWKGHTLGRYIFNDGCTELAFVATEKNNKVLYHYTAGMHQAELLADSNSADLSTAYTINDGELIFSRNSDKLLFQLAKKEEPQKLLPGKRNNVHVWSYKDEYTQGEQLKGNDCAKNQFWAVINFADKKIVKIEDEQTDLIIPQNFENYVLVSTGNSPTSFYNKKYPIAYYLVSTATGNKRLLLDTFGHMSISPDDQYVAWYDEDSLNYFSYETATGITRDISKAIPTLLNDTTNRYKHINFAETNTVGTAWGAGDHSIYVYDQYDIWKVDLDAKQSPVNITQGYGRQKGVVFGLVKLKEDDNTVRPNDELLLTGFAPKTKYNGFWKLRTGNNTLPIKLNMGTYSYYTAGYISACGSRPIKARDANSYLVLRQSAAEFPNYYFTTDFKTYKPVSNIHPESNYNWIKDELISWKMTDGRMSQGILYKPENFDPSKKYPVIFHYYEKRSNELNEYKTPGWTNDDINIPYFVSNGYLIFVPDIYYTQGHNGAGTVNAVVSAARYISKLPYVDSTKLGIQGHSFGGWETNYLVTHSKIFSAACEASGSSDLLSCYDEENGDRRQAQYEVLDQGTPYSIGATPWTRPDIYIENSPIFNVGNITTPLLMMHGDKDGAVPYAQALEMYFAMRRAGKKVWLLQYENAGHHVEGNDAKDYTIRIQQFFDYYLKGALPPKWMTVGVPAKLKGIDDGLALDTSVQQP